nr:hypothetical protein [Pedobacter glucosidilyticus]
MSYKLYMILLGFSLLFACKQSLRTEEIEGKWLYQKVEFLRQNPIIITEGEELKADEPYVVFEKSGKAKIVSSGKILSEGTFVLDGYIIRYEEVLPDGQKRAIPFLVKELNTQQLVFETMDQDTKRITAKKIKF